MRLLSQNWRKSSVKMVMSTRRKTYVSSQFMKKWRCRREKGVKRNKRVSGTRRKGQIMEVY